MFYAVCFMFYVACSKISEVIVIIKFFSFLSKSILFKKLAKSIGLAKFSCFNLAVKLSAVNLLNSGVVIYLLL